MRWIPPIRPFLPKFQHALLDLTRFDPASGDGETLLAIVLQLMKLVRQREILRFFKWLAAYPVKLIPEDLLGLMLLYALHADSDLDVQEIYPILSSNPELKNSTMSAAEKLKTEGRSEGRMEGGLIGKIQSLEEFLDLPPTSPTILEALSLEEIKKRHDTLRQQYEIRFKKSGNP